MVFDYKSTHLTYMSINGTPSKMLGVSYKYHFVELAYVMEVRSKTLKCSLI